MRTTTVEERSPRLYAEPNEIEPAPPGARGIRQSLMNFLLEGYLPSRVEVSSGYAENLRVTVGQFSRWLDRDAVIADLTEERISAFLGNYRGIRSARSTNNKRSHLLTLWMGAFDAGIIKRLPVTRRIRKLRAAVEPPTAWSIDNVGALLSYAGKVSGNVADVPSRLWWPALFATIYWTGCRVNAMLLTESNCYRRGEGVLVRAQKNKIAQWYPLPASCCCLIDATDPQTRELLFPWSGHPKAIFAKARKIIEGAGLECPRKTMQLFHRLRRTTLTLCAAVDPAVAQRQAGHSSYATTQRHYVDPRIARGRSAADVLPEPVITPRIPQST